MGQGKGVIRKGELGDGWDAGVLVNLSSKAHDWRVRLYEVAKTPEAQVTAGSALAGSVVGGGTGAVAGTVIGTTAGLAVGLVPALFTFGMSIPVCGVLGGGVGFCAGTATGASTGALVGGAAGYKTYGYLKSVKEANQIADALPVACTDTTNTSK